MRDRCSHKSAGGARMLATVRGAQAHPAGLLRLGWSHEPQMQWFPDKFKGPNATPPSPDGARWRWTRHSGGELSGLNSRGQVSHQPECHSLLLFRDGRTACHQHW